MIRKMIRVTHEFPRNLFLGLRLKRRFDVCSSTSFFAGRGVLVALLSGLLVLTSCQAPPTQTVVVPVPQPAPEPTETVVETIVMAPDVARCQYPTKNRSLSFLVEAWGTPDNTFLVGEPLRFQMQSSANSYVSVFYVGSSCKVLRLLKNYAVDATAIVNFPPTNSGINLRVTPPNGEEAFYIVATRTEFDFLSSPDIMDNLSEEYGIATLDLKPDQFYQRLDEALGRINPGDWSTKTLHTKVVEH